MKQRDNESADDFLVRLCTVLHGSNLADAGAREAEVRSYTSMQEYVVGNPNKMRFVPKTDLKTNVKMHSACYESSFIKQEPVACSS
jgi:hypothetical protein